MSFETKNPKPVIVESPVLAGITDPAELAAYQQQVDAINQNRDPSVGTDLDPNKAGNIHQQLADAANPVHPQSTEHYTKSEDFGELFGTETTLPGALGHLAANGVENHADGSYTLRLDGATTHVTEQGSIVQPQ